MVKVKPTEINWDQASVDKTLTSFSTNANGKVWVKNNLNLKNPNKLELLIWKVVKNSRLLRRVFFSVDYKVSQSNLEKIKPFILSASQKVQYNKAIDTFNHFAPQKYALAPLTDQVPPKPKSASANPKVPSEKKPDTPPPENPVVALAAKWDKQRISLEKGMMNDMRRLEEIRKCFKANIPAYLSFLETTPEENEIFITIGFGGVGPHTRHDQLWPGPLRQAINSGQKVKNILVDTHAQTVSGFELCMAAKKIKPDFSGKDWAMFMERLDIPQFGCGIVDETNETDDNSPPSKIDCRWDNAQQIRDFQDKWCQYNLRALQAGKNVHIGWYINTFPSAWIINFYNQHKEHFPNQLFFLVGSQDFGCIPTGKFDQEEVDDAREHKDDADYLKSKSYDTKYVFVDNGDFTLFLK
ncbi:MAG: hypothetical protein CK425_02675 [Parachlamydia sp.]|nr:MAG: hypothetical protein CK425_02675 [Parachlamydia sp.]